MVAGIASGGCTRIPGGVTTVTRHRRMSASKRETRLIVIKRCRCPTTRGMALLAKSRESCGHVIRITHAGVIAVMAGIARGWRSRVSGCVATVARHGSVRTCERESAQIVIE